MFPFQFFTPPAARLKSVRGFITALAIAVSVSGCAVVQVKTVTRNESTQRKESRVLLFTKGAPKEAAGLMVNAGKADGQARLAMLLEAARLTSASDADPAAQAVNRAATRQIVDWMEQHNFADQTLKSDFRTSRLTLVTTGKEIRDPRVVSERTPASGIQIKGLRQRVTQNGLGEPYVAWSPNNSPFLASQPGISNSGMAEPLTALVTFKGDTAKLRFQRTLVQDAVVVDGRSCPLAADFSAPIAVLLSKGKNRSIDLDAMFKSDAHLGDAGLFQFQPYDPNKIPVVFVHGLLSRPEAWTGALNDLQADPVIRERYQFWFFLYPTGLPVWGSSALLRGELDRYQEVFAKKGRTDKLKNMVMVGHSMGGLITSLMIREGGDKLWQQFSDVPVNELQLSPEAKKVFLKAVYFAPRKDISRAVFMATPHQGSELALRPFADFFANMIRLPVNALTNDNYELRSALRDDLKTLFVAPTNSIRFLRAKSPMLLSILNLPLIRDIPYHSIIGDRGRGDTPESSDGAVPYWSSHLPGAKTEKIVPSGHGVNENPEGIEELRRILRSSLGSS